MYYYWMYDPTMLLLIPAIILAMWAQFKVSSTFNKYSQIASVRGLTGADAARQILDRNGLSSVRVLHVAGNLTDHFDPRTNTVNLSDATYASNSIGAIGVAAHECGHAVQHATEYAPIRVRNAIVPVVSFCSKAAMPIILIGFILSAFGGFAPVIIKIGIILYAATVAFQIITLPVEFNASSRAIKTLESYSMLNPEEIKGARKVLSAAAMTYVAAAFSAIMMLLRLILLSNNRRRD
ncbi:MAG: zinc metallopeptidase [Clostridiales bacterium]|nr:zinc metallopeptidase [Clostridiales bacterium]